MKCFSVFLPLSALFLLAGHLGAQTFQNPHHIPTGQDPVSVFTVDMNGDGVPDLLYETEGNSTTSSTMNVFLGQPSGGYIAGPTLLLPTDVGGCRPVDANHDGKLDLVCLYWVDTFDMSIATFLGNGDGTFQAPIYSATMQSCMGCDLGFTGWIFTPADLNSDGNPDLLVGDALDQWIFVLLGDGTGRFTVKSVLGGYPTSEISGFPADAAMSITVEDINGDGKPDLLFSGGPTVLIGNGDGTFKTPATYVGTYFSCVYHDMDGDGHPDAVCANVMTGNQLAILRGNADGSFNTTPIFTKTYITSDLPDPVAILDVNGDGILDILADSSDGLEVLLGEPGLKFADPVHYSVGYPASNGELSSQFADLKRDGHTDVVAAGPNGIYISGGSENGTFSAAPAYEVAQTLGHVTVGDFNGDGIPDIAATGDQSIELSLGNGDGTFKPYTALPNGGIDFSTGGILGDAQIVHGDFTGNGKQDILAIGSPGTYEYDSYILYGNGDGMFASPQLVPNTSVIYPAYHTMAVLDINNDGRDDVLTTDSSHIYSALSNGDGTFTTVTTQIPTNTYGMNPSFPAFADFSHDGKLDAAYGLSSSVQILKGHGDGTFDSTGVNLPIPAYMGKNPSSSATPLVKTGDFDGDGNPDIAVLVEIVPQIAPWTSQILTVAYVYYGKGDGTFSSPVLAGAFNREYAGIFAADLNKDGLTDIVLQTNGAMGFLASPSGDALGVLLSKPGRAFGQEVNYTGGQIESGLVIADLNGDGYPDLLAINSGYFANGDYLSLPPNTVTELLNLGAKASGTLVPTTTTLVSSNNPATIGTAITFTATVAGLTPGEGVPTGSVIFTDQTGIDTAAPLVAVSTSAASATLTTSAIGIGSDTVIASYSGDSVFATSSAYITQTVTGDPVTMAFTATPNPVVAGRTAALEVTVANPRGSSAPAPTGSISFSDGSSTLAEPIPLSAGAAAFNATFSVAGMHALTASYSGDALHAASTAPWNERVLTSPPLASGPKEWVWMGGSSTIGSNCNQEENCGQPGVYGALGTPAAGNIPGGRFGAATWTDSGGNLWLFGGDGFDASGTLGELNDLWEFNPSTNQWTWMGGNSTAGNNCGMIDYCGRPGVYGALGTPAAGNVPGGRFSGTSWTDSSGNFWLFGGFGYDVNGKLGYLNDLWEFDPFTKLWVWVSGSSTIPGPSDGQPGVYGALGVPAASNIPGGRSVSVSWVDSSGNFWLFAGLGYDANGMESYLNDLWEFNPSTKLWAWMGGSSTRGSVCGLPDNCGRPGVYGTLGTPAAGNIPGGRQSPDAWTDSSGHLWLFGGFGFDSNGGWDALNDLWQFNPSTDQWTWMGGNSTIASNGAGQPAVYGTLGVPAAGNNPGGHYDSASWIDGNGDLWLLGGWVTSGPDSGNQCNDLWEFNPSINEWTWWGGSTTLDEAGVYGTLGVLAAGNFPGTRSDSAAWTDNSGNAWLFGGWGYDAADRSGALNDLWSYQPAPALPAAATPTFSPAAGSYATAQSVTISDTTPGAIIYYTTNGTTPTAASNVYSRPISVMSSETIEAIATATGYATSGVATATYTITAQAAAMPTFSPVAGNYATAQSVTISDTTPGAIVYYTTDGTIPATTSKVYTTPIAVSASETLKAISTASGYTTSQVTTAAYVIASSSSGTGEWAWMGGSSTLGGTLGRSGVYGTLGAPAPGNIPGSRESAAGWTDNTGNLWMFGGLSNNGKAVGFNDLWEFSPSTNEWTWMSGSSTESCSSSCGQPGTYGTMGTAAAGNGPGGRWSASSWADTGGHLWLYGGYGFDANGVMGWLNDLWEFNPSTNQWTWMSGSSTLPITGEGYPPVYGPLGTFAAGNNPGGRWIASAWTDSSGHFWMFGGEGYYAAGVAATFNDLWEFDPSTNQWAWMGGSNTAGSNCPNGVCQHAGVYGTLGTPAAGNVPGSRDSAVTWTDARGHLWLFGGSVPGISITYLDDLWEYFPATNEWAWMSGGSELDQPGIYGTTGAPAAGNIPGGRCCMVSWTDSSGLLWLFGGQGYDANDNPGDLNDLWAFNPSTREWAWMGGGSTVSAIDQSQPGVYGTLGVPAPGNIPGGRQASVSWIGKSGNFWLFGGVGADANGSLGNLNDLWRYGSAASTQPSAATPTFSPAAGSYPTAQSVTISDTTPGAIIYYTTNGTTPTAASNVYSRPIPVSSTETIEAIATASGYTASAVASATYNVAVSTTTTLTALPASLSYGQALTLTATVTPASGAAPSGTVTFYNGAASLGTANLNGSGVATLQLTPAVGSYSFTASYAGSADDAASVSAPVTLRVAATATTTTLTASPNPAPFGVAVTFMATVGSSTVVPAGSVSLYDGPALLTTATLASGSVSYSTSALSVGAHNITATYAGESGFNGSTSNVVVEVISPADFSISASPASKTIYTGEAASYSVTITPGTGFNLPVALSCTQLPVNTACTFSPATVSTGSGRSTLIIQTAAPGPGTAASSLSIKTGVSLLAGFLLLFIPRRLRRYRSVWPMFPAILACLAMGAAISGCGAPASLAGGTPVGAETVTVTATATNGSQTLTHATTVTLDVKSLF